MPGLGDPPCYGRHILPMRIDVRHDVFVARKELLHRSLFRAGLHQIGDGCHANLREF